MHEERRGKEMRGEKEKRKRRREGKRMDSNPLTSDFYDKPGSIRNYLK